MDKKFYYFYALIAALMLLLPFSASYAEEGEPIPVKKLADVSEMEIKTEPLVIQTADGRAEVFQIEKAADPKSRERGLMDRHSMDKNEGMLFLFDDEEVRYFWMKNTYIPLDMLFISADGTIAHIHHNARPQDETPISSKAPVSAVLEIKGGVSRELDIKEGDKVLSKAFGNTLAH